MKEKAENNKCNIGKLRIKWHGMGSCVLPHVKSFVLFEKERELRRDTHEHEKGRWREVGPGRYMGQEKNEQGARREGKHQYGKNGQI